jgi:hypothetical protein
MWVVSRKRMGKRVATERLIPGLRNKISRDTETESCKHLENQIFALEIRHGFRDNAFMKNNNGRTLGGGDLYSVLSQL